ncbi:MAG TPA: hypothetical protein VJ455_08070 [Ignavibacteria bacterium]|nr:hypothetical protein [Ignavibacteria bacterium]
MTKEKLKSGKKHLNNIILLIFIVVLYSCTIKVSDSDDDGGNGNNNSYVIIENPNPYDGAVDVPLTPILMWSCTSSNTNNLMYEIYLDTITPPVKFLSGQPYYNTSYYVTDTLTANKIYYWHIRAVYDNGNYTSSTWRFTTISVGGK